MANTQALKRRIKSAKNIKQITKAMEMVSASKMRRSQSQALGSRPYARKLRDTLRTIATYASGASHPLLSENEMGEDLVVIVSTDRSLAGSLNTNLFRHSHEYINSNYSRENLSAVIIGTKALGFAFSANLNLAAKFVRLPDPLSFHDTLPISHLFIDNYLNKNFRSVTVLYMDFVSTLTQEFRAVPLLPVPTQWDDVDEIESTDIRVESSPEYIFEPSTASILNWLLPYYVELTVFQILLEAKAAEHSARMVAMKNASENAGEIIEDLTLIYNRSRQESITSEIADIATASMIVSS